VNCVVVKHFDHSAKVTVRIAKHMEDNFLDIKVDKRYLRDSAVKLQISNLPCRFIQILVVQDARLSRTYSEKQLLVKAVSSSKIRDCFGEDYLSVLDPFYLAP
jgi:hypothetical protein